jgi:ubiquinone/menaquinone biosynthesis C-methylase UbiE
MYPIRDGIADFLGPPRPTTPAQATNEWPLTAWAYERVWRPFALTILSGEEFSYRRELPLIAEMAAAERGGLVLDVACSNGLYARALTRARRNAAGHVIGIDHSFPMLVEARRRAQDAGLRISYVRATAQALPIDSNCATATVIGGSLNEIGDLDACLAEARRVLTPTGRFVVMTLTQATTSPGQSIQRLLSTGGVTFYDRQELRERFAQHGLQIIRTQQHGIVLFMQSGEY